MLFLNLFTEVSSELWVRALHFPVCFANFKILNYFGRGEIVECLTRFYQVQYLPIKLVDICQKILESKYDSFKKTCFLFRKE